MNTQFLAPAIDLDPYSGESGVATVESFEEGCPVDSVECNFEDGVWAFQEECRRIKGLREKNKELPPIVVRLLYGDKEEMKEII